MTSEDKAFWLVVGLYFEIALVLWLTMLSWAFPPAMILEKLKGVVG